ncbi:MAG: UxaA family hydrolase [Lentisphaeria bacterium]|nr:UxaA family hydrolase [Lentisphaeria bacterium]NQZ68042.1 UxaA family hydrolase [Lentisphaeria bacterium]
MKIDLNALARIPVLGDNVAVALRDIEPGTIVSHNGTDFSISHYVLVGHRFAIESIQNGDALLSWNLTFGFATGDIVAGTYLCNEKMIEQLSSRILNFDLPTEGNFVSFYEPYEFEVDSFVATEQLGLEITDRHFMGFDRANGTCGTRNTIIILPVSGASSIYAQAVADRFKSLDDFENVDAVVALSHTEATGNETINSMDLLLRTLAGFIVHANVAAVVIIDDPAAKLDWEQLKSFMQSNSYPLDHVLLGEVTVTSFRKTIAEAEAYVRDFLVAANKIKREKQPLSKLRIALQCGGSDAFSGISGNPLAGQMARAVILEGGAANLAETNELVGAESYILANCKDSDTAEKFLSMIARFRRIASYHGHTLEDNPSGGNYLRGLYNIAIKSIGAAQKKQADVRLDWVIDYGENKEEPGYYFMDSPGNDIESIAGQVAWGANMILFVTGNGSITNFPFVPTIKIITTSSRHELLNGDMDINAGQYIDGVPMETLTDASVDYMLNIASGEQSVGEKASHFQLSIWHNWRLTQAGLNEAYDSRSFTGEPLKTINLSEWKFEATVNMENTGTDFARESLALVMPTSLCSAQVSKLFADKLNENPDYKKAVSKFVTIPHTEGCGSSSGKNVDIAISTLIGYITHPAVKSGLFLEHGCEKTHNDYFRQNLIALGKDPDNFGWVSIQLDGGIDNASELVTRWFDERLANESRTREDRDISDLSIGIISNCDWDLEDASVIMAVIRQCLASGVNIVLANSDPLCTTASLQQIVEEEIHSTLEYGQRVEASGLHIMESPGGNSIESITGFGACGVDLILNISERVIPSHPFIPIVQIAIKEETDDFDCSYKDADALMQLIFEVAAMDYEPKLDSKGQSHFQLSRGYTGMSM